jgi:MSHA biogenesis protein MshN
MSLINQMLKDLEERGGLKSEESTVEASAGETETAKVKRKSNPTFLAISGVLIVVYLAGYYWFTASNKTTTAPQKTIVQNIPQQSTVAQAEFIDGNAEENSNEAIIAEITAAIESEIQANAGEVNQKQIQEMVIAATKSKVDMPAGELEQVITGRIDFQTQAQPNNVVAPVKVAKMKKVAKPKVAVKKVAKSSTISEAKQYQKLATAAKAEKVIKNQETPKAIKTIKKELAKVVAPTKKYEKVTPAAVQQVVENTVAVVKKAAPATTVKTVAPKKKIRVAKAKKPARKPTSIAKPLGKAHFVKQTNPSQKSEHLYQEAISLVQKGRVTEAQNILAQALKAYPANQDARQTLAALLLDNNRVAEAKTVLSQGLVINPDHTPFRMAVARLEVELGNRAGALNTLLDGANQATDNAKYQAFLATMLQREHRHEEAVKHFQYALGIDRGMTKAFVGLGMSLQALNRFEDAQVAYNNAQSNSSLNPNLKSFLDGRIKEVNHRISAR